MITKLLGTQRETAVLLLLAAVAGVLLLANLGNQYLWQDEAQTALVSRTVLDGGLPRGTDGRNFFSQELGAEYGEDHIWRWHTWLPFYLLAGFFKAFGVSTLVARLPFALFGIGCIVLIFLLARALFRNRATAVIASLLLATTVPFLILSRQCRYYSLAAFFSIWSLLAYSRLLERRRSWPFVLAATLLFHTHYVYCVTLLITACLHALVMHRDRIRAVLVACGVVLLVNAPWIVWFSGMRYGQQYSFNLMDPGRLLGFAAGLTGSVLQHLAPLWLLLLVPLAYLGARRKNSSFLVLGAEAWSGVLLLVLYLAVNLAVLSVVSPAPFFRYLAPVIPAVILLVAVLVSAAGRLNPAVAVAALAVWVLAGPMSSFLYEITHDYDGPIESIVKYLEKHGTADDLVVITYGDMPLKFYTDMRVLGGLTGEDLSPVRQADWVILRRNVISDKDAAVHAYIARHLTRDDFEQVELDAPDIPFENREDPSEHLYRNVTDPRIQKVSIFRRSDH